MILRCTDLQAIPSGQPPSEPLEVEPLWEWDWEVCSEDGEAETLG
jgi:hypothetical protein